MDILFPVSEQDVYTTPKNYYGGPQRSPILRRNSLVLNDSSDSTDRSLVSQPQRRGSHDADSAQSRQFIVPVDETLRELLEREDTDGNMQITIADSGPKAFTLGTTASSGIRGFEIRGTYRLSNLLKELSLAKEHGRKRILLDEARINENPVDRLNRFIRDMFWDGLARRIDGSNIENVGELPNDWTVDRRPRIYIPRGAPEQYAYYTRISEKHPEMQLEVLWLPEDHEDSAHNNELNHQPGLLAIAMDEIVDPVTGDKELRGKPFCVYGAQFNLLSGWSGYTTSLGLLIHNRVDMAKSMVEHLCFTIQHYGHVLPENSSCYLGCSQPPFLTDMALRVYQRIKHEPGALEFLRIAILAAIKEYYNVWMSEPRLDPQTGLSRYHPRVYSLPPDLKISELIHIIEPHAKKRGMGIKKFIKAYDSQQIKEPELDEYFLNRRAALESGHDMSSRFENGAAYLATVDLNSLLYKYESDIASTIRHCFDDSLQVPPEFCAKHMTVGHVETSTTWERRAKRRQASMGRYMWNEDQGMFFDYDTAKKEQSKYESVTTFWPMWSGMATPRQALSLVEKALPKFERTGGLLSGTERSRMPLGLEHPLRSWDYPLGWAPHQMLAWAGFLRYGYRDEAERLAYKWLLIVTKTFADFNGVVAEKYDVTRPIDPHNVDGGDPNCDYDLKGVPREGFAWTNASYVYGSQIINPHMKRALGALTPYETYAKSTEELEASHYGLLD